MIKRIVTPRLIRVILLVSACGALALIVNVFTGISSIPGGYTIIVAPNSPKHKINDKTNAANNDGTKRGKLIFKKVFLEEMPNTEAASSNEAGICLTPLPIIRDAIKPNFPNHAMSSMADVL